MAENVKKSADVSPPEMPDAGSEATDELTDRVADALVSPEDQALASVDAPTVEGGEETVLDEEIRIPSGKKKYYN